MNQPLTQQKATNVHWHHGDVTREDRIKLLGQKGATLWFTGLSGSGKSTIAVALENRLFQRGNLSNLRRSPMWTYLNTPSAGLLVDAADLKHADNSHNEVHKLIRHIC